MIWKIKMYLLGSQKKRATLHPESIHDAKYENTEGYERYIFISS